MKKLLIIMFAIVGLFVFANGMAIGQTQAQSQAANLPAAGLTPESPFYFLNTISEAFIRFFTFNKEDKARLEIKFAKERIAEIKAILEEKGINAKGLSAAESGLQDNLSRAAAILEQEKQAGKDTSSLAKELANEVKPAQDVLKETFKSQKDALEAKMEELKTKIKAARLAGDAAQVDDLTKQLADLKAQLDLLDQNENDNEDAVSQENDRIDEALGLKEEAAKKISEAENDKAEIMQESKDGHYDIPTDAFDAFDKLILQAKAAFDSGNYEEAKSLAKEAKNNLEDVKHSLEKLQEFKDKQDELKQEAEQQQQELENKLKEADKKSAELIKEEMKQQGEQLIEEQKNAAEQQKQIEEDLKSINEH